MITLSIAGDVAEVVLDAPEKLNALSLEALAELDSAYADAAASGVRVLLLRGEGAPSAPAETSPASTRRPMTSRVPRRRRASHAPHRRSSRADVRGRAGACLGVGLGLAIATDVVYVADTAKIGSPFVHIGAVLDSGGHAVLYERLGAHRALDLIYTGDLLPEPRRSQQDCSAGRSPWTTCSPSRASASSGSPRAPQALLASKRLIGALRDEHLWDVLADETAAQDELRDTADYREGFAAFQDKRRPGFSGR